VFSQHSPAERIDFAKRNGGHAGALEAEVECADTGKKAEHVHSPASKRRGGRTQTRAW
jgi:hypothetical protein